jgi:peptidoglycan/xylan/chitin deacetylase (PgdA/CDA1 family)
VSDTLVLCYHAVSPTWPAALSITPEQLEEQLAHVLRHGHEPVTFSDAVARADTPGKRVAITFDDAFRSVGTLAKPILDRLGAVASVFVPTAFPGTGRPLAWQGTEGWLGSPHEEELESLSWEELAALPEAGWEVGSHSRSHPRLSLLEDEALRDELAGSRRDCEERLGRACVSLAYPYGDHDARVVGAAAQAGYRYAGTLPELRDRMHAPGPLEWPRVGIYHGEPRWRWRLKMSASGRRVRAARAWGVAGRR